MDGGRAVGAERPGDRLGVGATVERLDGSAELTGLGQEFERDRGDVSVECLGVDPDTGNCHVGRASSDDLELLEERHDLLVGVPLVDDLLSGLGSSAGVTAVISWRAPAQPTWPASMPRSASVTWSTGLFLAAMIPLKEG